jgi:hypothetical protein
MIKRILVILALLCGSAVAQTPIDITINQIGPYFDIARGVTWNVSGIGGYNNNYIFTPQSPEQGVCIYVYNNDTVNTYSASFIVLETGDQQTSKYTGNTARWFQILSTGPITIGPAGTTQFFFKTSGAARAVIATGGGTGNAGTMDMVAVQTQQGCGPRSNSPVSCTLVKSQVIPTATTVTFIANSTNATSIHICSYSVTIGGATVAAATSAFIQGSGVNCATAPITVWRLANGPVNTVFQLSGGAGEIFEVGPSLNICYTDGGTTAGSTLSVSYALF